MLSRFNDKPNPAIAPFEWEEATIAQLQEGMQTGKLTARSLVENYLESVCKLTFTDIVLKRLKGYESGVPTKMENNFFVFCRGEAPARCAEMGRSARRPC